VEEDVEWDDRGTEEDRSNPLVVRQVGATKGRVDAGDLDESNLRKTRERREIERDGREGEKRGKRKVAKMKSSGPASQCEGEGWRGAREERRELHDGRSSRAFQRDSVASGHIFQPPLERQ